MCLTGVAAIISKEDAISFVFLVAALSLAILLGMQMEKYNNAEEERIEQLISK